MSEMKSRASFLVINKVLQNRGGRKKGTQEEDVSIVEVGNLEIKFSNSLIIHKEINHNHDTEWFGYCILITKTFCKFHL